MAHSTTYKGNQAQRANSQKHGPTCQVKRATQSLATPLVRDNGQTADPTEPSVTSYCEGSDKRMGRSEQKFHSLEKLSRTEEIGAKE